MITLSMMRKVGLTDTQIAELLELERQEETTKRRAQMRRASQKYRQSEKSKDINGHVINLKMTRHQRHDDGDDAQKHEQNRSPRHVTPDSLSSYKTQNQNINKNQLTKERVCDSSCVMLADQLGVTPPELENLTDSLIDWHLSKDIDLPNPPATLRLWIRRLAESKQKGKSNGSTRPQSANERAKNNWHDLREGVREHLARRGHAANGADAKLLS